MFRIFKKEKRSSVENPNESPGVQELFSYFSGMPTDADINITIDKALEVPAIWAAVNFLAGTLAGLPLNVYRKTKQGRKKINGGLQDILHDAPNDTTSSFEWRKYMFERALTGGRGLTFIDRNAAGKVVNLYSLVPQYVTVSLNAFGQKIYKYSYPGKASVTYSADEIIDIPFMLKADGYSHKSPITSAANSIALWLAATKFGSKFFNGGGVVPFFITGPLKTKESVDRAALDFQNAIKKASEEKRIAVAAPPGFDVKTVGTDPEKSQLVELKKYLNEEFSRLYSLPVVFIQDLTKGTFANTEQQDLHLVKHTVKRWVEATEQELNLKIFGRNKGNLYIEFNVDGLLRGDYKTRIEGHAKAISNGIKTPNEIRRMENDPDHPSGNELMIQGATVPIQNQLNFDKDSGDKNE